MSNSHNNIAAFIAHREVGGFWDSKPFLGGIAALGSATASIAIYKNLATIGISIVLVGVLIVFIRTVFRKQKSELFLIEFLKEIIVLGIFGGTLFPLLLNLNSGEMPLVGYMVLALWIVTAMSRWILIQARIHNGYYAKKKCWKPSTLGTDLIVVAIAMGGIWYCLFKTSINDSICICLCLSIVTIIPWHMPEAAMMHYYVKKYNLEGKMRVM